MKLRTITAATLSVVGVALLSAVAACNEDRIVGFDSRAGEPDFGAGADAGDCPFQCSIDGRSIVRACTGDVVETCPPELACGGARCQEPCAAAAEDKSSNGCEFYFQQPPTNEQNSCYAAFVVNTSTQPVELFLERDGKALDVSRSIFRTNPETAALAQHTGPIPPGESIVLFIADHDPDQPYGAGHNHVSCPADAVPAYLSEFKVPRTELGVSFHLTASQPVSMVTMYPFGGAASFISSASLLLPVGSWAKQHVAVGSWESSGSVGSPTMQILASEDDTDVTILPSVDIGSGAGIKGTGTKLPATYRLARGQSLQFVQPIELTGSIITSTKPTAVFSGHTCVNLPNSVVSCDVLSQQIPAFEQWGSEYVGVGYRPRRGNEHELMLYRIVAGRDGTRLDYDPAIPPGAPTEMSAGETAIFATGTGDAFVVRTQDAEHPIYVAAYMTGWYGDVFGVPVDVGGQGDPEFVNVIPAGQYLNSYSFYADPTYPETSLVVVRAKSRGEFKDVWLECAGTLPEFRPVGTRGDYEFTRVDLSKDFGPGQKFGSNACRAGLQRMRSEGPFTATLWGWGRAVSYAAPGGMAYRKLVTTPLVDVQ